MRLIPLERSLQKFFQDVGKIESETVQTSKMVTQPKKTFCLPKFCATKSVATVHYSFQRKLHKIPPCAHLVLMGTFAVKCWKSLAGRSVLFQFLQSYKQNEQWNSTSV